MIPRSFRLPVFLLLLGSAAFGVAAATLTIDGVEFAYRLPAGPPRAIMVLFGGRNWQGADTLKRFRFDELADRHRLILLSPSFRDRNYWEPGKWSGPALKRAVSELERRCRMPSRRLLFYGYSAGGQCANLFYAWMPEKVAAWGAHACGVYFTGKVKNPAPALVTCGTLDDARWSISRTFISNYRENGGKLLWKYSRNGHELSPQTLELARAWFDALLTGGKNQFVADDDSREVLPISRKHEIDPEYRNEIPNRNVLDLWLK